MKKNVTSDTIEIISKLRNRVAYTVYYNFLNTTINYISIQLEDSLNRVL